LFKAYFIIIATRAREVKKGDKAITVKWEITITFGRTEKTQQVE